MLLVTIGVTCSVRLGWPVAMFCSAICIAFGLMVDFIASIVTIGGVWALNYNRPAEPDAVYHFFDKSATLAWNFLGFIASVVPNFTVFKPDQFIGNLQNMPWSVVWSNTGTALAFALPFVALSYLMFRKQELG